jgi:hypothetical protein
MNRRLLTFVIFAGLAIAGGKTYTIYLNQPAAVGDAELKPGEYQVRVDGDKTVIRVGKTAVETPVKVETASAKYPATSVRLEEREGKRRITEIHLGGTTTRLVFSE